MRVEDAARFKIISLEKIRSDGREKNKLKRMMMANFATTMQSVESVLMMQVIRQTITIVADRHFERTFLPACKKKVSIFMLETAYGRKFSLSFCLPGLVRLIKKMLRNTFVRYCSVSDENCKNVGT